MLGLLASEISAGDGISYAFPHQSLLVRAYGFVAHFDHNTLRHGADPNNLFQDCRSSSCMALLGSGYDIFVQARVAGSLSPGLLESGS